MEMKQKEIATCDCGAAGTIHNAKCELFSANATSIPAIRLSRRGLIVAAVTGGAGAALMMGSREEAHADIFMPSMDDQKKLGDKAAGQILEKYKEVKDSRANHFNSIGTKLVNALSRKDRGTWDFKFHVIDSKEINAFAVPGGNMFMFTGLLDRVATDDELAAVTGHEMMHVRAQHWAKAAAAQSKREAVLGILVGLTKAGRIGQLIAGGIDTITGLKFSRKEEDEADAGGLTNMVRAGYDPHGMIDLFRLLELASGKNGGPPEFLSDHPITKDRIRRTQERIDRL